MSIPGKLLYHAWHRPLNRLSDCLRAGGPFEIRRTETGRREMELAAHALQLPPPVSGNPVELHLLTGRRFWYQTAFCLWSFARQAGLPVTPVIYDDGSLTEEVCAPFRRLFPMARFVAQAEIVARLDAHLPIARFPTLRERWRNYPNIRKLIDVHLGCSGWKLVLDSDLLFFRRPQFLLDWLARPDRPLHAVDCMTSYGYSRRLLDELASAPLAERVNVGLAGFNSGQLDWEHLEFLCRTLIQREQTNYYLEQALIAILVAGHTCAVAPAADYVTMPAKSEAREPTAVMHHYVAHSKRWYFQANWRRVQASQPVLPSTAAP